MKNFGLATGSVSAYNNNFTALAIAPVDLR